MARVYPNALPAYVLENPLRSAECRVYDRLREGLDDGFVVFYSRPWLGLTPEGEEVDGEADFVVAHPEHGILVIEVKGGAVSRDGHTGQWESVDRHGRTHRIKDPVNQARRSKYRILEKVKSVPFWDGGYIRIRHGVVFPDSANPGKDLGADMPLHIFAFAEDMERLSTWVAARLKEAPSETSAQGRRFDPLGQKGIRALTDLLARSFQLRTPLVSSLEAEDQQIQVLTEQQYQILEFLIRAPRCAVEGGAGSGKTVLASELAYRLLDRGGRILLTCFNRPLADHLSRALAGADGLVVKSFHQFCGWVLRRAGVEIAQSDGQGPTEFFGRELVDAFVEAIGGDAVAKFDAILVDEAQDFRPDWLAALELCLRDPASDRFHLFFDNNQRLYPEIDSGVRAEIPPYPLTRNLRNSRAIFELTHRFYRGDAYTPAGPEGREVEFVPCRSADLDEVLVQRLGQLIREERVRPGDIAVLSENRDLISERTRERIKATYGLVDASALAESRIVVDTIRRFKGLERRVVLLVVSEAGLDDPELAYVGFSRARLHLQVIGPRRVIEAIQDMGKRSGDSESSE